MNDKLLTLYSELWKPLCGKLEEIIKDDTIEDKPTNPLLLTIDDEEDFKQADIRIMFFGQETNSWNNFFNEDLNSTLKVYEEFYNQGECWSYGGQFWNGIKRFCSILKNKYPDKKVRIVGNNIVKIGKFDHKGFPGDSIYNIERNYFPVIKQEIEIIKPNVLLFLSGPNYDSRIRDNFGEISFEPIGNFTEKQLAKVNLDFSPLAFRTYHPNYLWRNGIDDYFNAIVDEIDLEKLIMIENL